MGGVAAVAVGIGSMIASAASTVVSVVSTVVGTLASAVASVAAAIGTAVGSIVGSVTQIFSAIYSAISVGSASIAAAITNPIASFAGTIFQYAHAIYAGVQALTKALHLKMIMRVHSIAYIVSRGYRRMIRDVYNNIADMGEAIGASKDGIILAFTNAGAIVKDAAAVMGRSYDLADVIWLKTLKRYLNHAENRIKKYRNGLVQIIPDIEKHVIKPALDALADMQRNWFSIFESMGESIDSVFREIAGLFNDVDKVRSDLNQLVGDLPDFIGDTVQPWINEINQEFTHFENEVYRPFRDNTRNIINILQGKQAQHKQEIKGIVDRLLRPGDLLKSVDELNIAMKIDQENKVGEIASRPMEREADNLESQASDAFEHLEKIRAILSETIPPPEWKIIERPEPAMPAGGQSKKAETWYVGDY